MLTGAQAILRVLEEAGIQYIFGVPGGGSMLIFTECYDHRDALQPILVRNEQVAAVMADAYARASGRPAAILGQGAFIASYASFGIMEALMSSSPIVALTDTSDFGMGPRPVAQSGTGEYGSVDLLGSFRAMTKYTSYATTAKEAAIGLQLAVKHAISGNPGPACLLFRSAAALGEINLEAPPFLHPTAGYLARPAATADAASVERAVALLGAAANPVIVAGKGVHNARAHSELKAVAERWAIPVATSYKGKTALEEVHPLALGMMGTYGNAVANAVVSEADTVLVVGAKLTSNDTAGERLINPARQKLIQIDIEPNNAGWAVPLDVPLIGDAKAVLGQLLQASPNGNQLTTKARRRTDQIQERKRQEHFFAWDERVDADSSPVFPQRLARLLQEHLDPTSNICLDAGNNRLWMGLFYQSRKSHSIFAPGGLAGMGWALPASLGVKLARPEEPSVAVCGDGGFMMSVQALATATQHDLPITVVVMNDSGLGMVRQHQGARGIASEFPQTDYATIGEGFGCKGFRVHDSRDLPDAIREAQASGGPAVIDVQIEPTLSPDIYRATVRAATET
jgi:acetolactate synthase-1/2/3 large subunit